MTLNFINSILTSPFKPSDAEYTPESPASISVESLPGPERPLKMQVSIRIRPVGKRHPSGELYMVQNSTSLVTKHFSSAEAARNAKPETQVNRKKYTFSKIFDSKTNQSKFFNEAIKPTVVDFLNNRSSTVISYGTTDSGKTYSLFGTSANPGVVPRCIEFVYSSINCTLTPWYKPKRFGSVVNLNENDRSLEIATKEKLLSCRQVDSSVHEESYEKLENSRTDGKQEIFKDSMYSVWVSFVEIYNDTIYDLLEVDEEGKNMQLKLANDKNGYTFIQGMRSVCATTGLEAYEILTAGQSRLSTVSLPNYKTSRSHSIFTIKLLKYNKDSSPNEVQVSSMTFYDLAGCGRIQKAIKDKKELKESSSINTSLLSLGRCFKFVAQDRPRRSAGPFRDSKLTRLIQRPLCGHESIVLLVSINPEVELYAETQNTLNFAATAMRLTSENSRDDKNADSYSPLASPKVSVTSTEATTRPKPQEINDLIMKNQLLASKLKELQSAKWKTEYDIRQELATLHAKQLHDLEACWRSRMLAMEKEKENLLQFTVSKVKNFYKEKLDECTNRKRRRSDRGDFEDRVYSEMFEKGDNFSKILSTKKSLESIKMENKELMAQKTKYAFELSLLKKCLKKFVETVNISCENVEVNKVANIPSMLTKNGKVSLDDDVRSHFAVLQKLSVKLKSLEKTLIELRKKEPTETKEIQCDSLCVTIVEFCKEIQNIFDPESVSLPELNDSLDSVKQTDEDIVNDVTSYLSSLRESIINYVSKTSEIEKENSEKLQEAKNLKSAIQKLEKENLQLKEQLQESELIKLSLTKKLEDITVESNSKELFKNHEFITVESENSLATETSRLTICSDPQSNLKNTSIEDSQTSLYGIESEKNESVEKMNSSDRSSTNDSGISSVCRVNNTEEKCIQTNVLYDESKNNAYEEKFVQLKLDYKCIKAQHFQESLRVSELCQELERMKEALTMLKENSSLKEQVISDCKNQLSSLTSDLELTRHEKETLQAKCREQCQKLLDAQTNFEKKLIESQSIMKIREEGENKAAKCLDDFYDKTVNLRSELSIAYSQIEKMSVRCFKEHVVKIDQLEKELSSKKAIEASLEEKVTQYEKDLVEVQSLADKVECLEIILEKEQRTKEDLKRLLNEQVETQSEVQQKVDYLKSKLDDREEQVQSIKTEINIITRTNLLNSRKAKEFGKEISKLMDDNSGMKEKINQTEETWKNLEQISMKELEVLRDRLNEFKENKEILHSLCVTHDSRNNEIEKLKIKLRDKESELEFFKQNRNATIQRYECLVRQLQNALKVNSHTSRLRKIFPYKHKYFFHDVKESLPRDVHSQQPQTSDWKSPNKNHTIKFSSSLEVTSSFSEDAEEVEEKEEDSTFLIASANKKCSESRKKAPLKILPTHYEESDSCIDVEDTKPEVLEADRKIRKGKSQTRFFLSKRKSSKDSD